MEAVPCTPTDECKYSPLCYEDTHHLYYHKKRYRSKIERQFRQLPENQVELCRAVHDERHATEQIPPKPSRDEMLQVIGKAGLYE